MAEGNKTEKATPKKRRDEREKGNVFLSQDAVAVVTLLGTFLMLQVFAGTAAGLLAGFMKSCFSGIGDPAAGVESLFKEFTLQGMLVLLKAVGPVALVAILCAVVATFAQTRLLVSGALLKPKFSRLSPIQGFKRLFSMRSIVEALKGILKIAILLIIIYLCLKATVDESAKYLYVEIPYGVSHWFGVMMGMVWKIAVAFVVLAAADFFYQWWDYERQLKMTKQEVKEEYKQVEGDPKVKARIRDIQRQMARTRMMQQVPQADVVIRNPTHVAVALRYKPGKDNAPVVLALGLDELALRIVRTAEEHKIAVVENVPLARALYAGAELNKEIPTEFYGAVAEVLVYIFRLNGNSEIVK